MDAFSAATSVTMTVTKDRWARHISCGILRLCSEIGKHIAEPPEPLALFIVLDPFRFRVYCAVFLGCLFFVDIHFKCAPSGPRLLVSSHSITRLDSRAKT
jgi:hypothetical protein